MFLCIVGDDKTGFTFVGPFNYERDAVNHCQEVYADCNWHVTTILVPLTPDKLEVLSNLLEGCKKSLQPL
jgi:hypothetical protein